MFFKDPIIISNLYDSHVHWMYTGQMASMWNLRGVVNPKELLNQSLNQHQLRGQWVTGFGWDENLWPQDFKVHRQFLDQAYPDQPVFLSRVDGHTSWVNTAALQHLGLWDQPHQNPDMEYDDEGIPTGVLKESAHIKALFSLPEFSKEIKRQHLIVGADCFNRAGFTHIRDMTSNLEQWQLHHKISDQLLLHVEHWFTCESLENLSSMLQQAQEARSTENSWQKMRGLKVFIDGSLGSHTAFLSSPYQDVHHMGQMNWALDDIKTVLREAWKNQFEVALHVLGDESAHQVVQAARQVYSEGCMGRIHLEHVEILRPETLQALKSLHVRCHLQPCHWFSDSKWLHERLGNLAQYAFPWQALYKARIPFSFGSDSPIENSSLFENLRALQESSRQGVPALSGAAVEFHQYPYSDSFEAQTVIHQDKVLSLRIADRERKFT